MFTCVGNIGLGFGPATGGEEDYPAAANVLNTDTVNGAAGTLTLPDAALVLEGTLYGVGGDGSTGTYRYDEPAVGGLDVTAFELAAARAQVSAFGEAIVYKPSGGTARGMLAIISRDPAGRVGGGRQTVGPKLSVFVVNAAADGIIASEFVPNKDKINLPVTLNTAPTDRLLTRILRQDGGMLEIEVG